MEFGFFDRPQTDGNIPLYNLEAREVALEEARSGMVLLKNENHLLPLDRKKIKTIAVLGPNAYPTPVGGGGSSLTTPFHSVSFLEGISDVAGKDVSVLYLAESTPLDTVILHTAFATSPGGAPGLRGEYFDNEEFKGDPALVRTDERVDFHWGAGSYRDGGPVDHFAVRWTGYFEAPNEDDYRFTTSAGDGERLYINEELVIDDWKRHAETVNSFQKHLEAGKSYKIRLEYFENVGTATVRFGVAPISISLGEEARNLVAKADAVVLCMGFEPESETEGSDRRFRLPGGQDSFIEQVTAVNKNVVVVLNAGGNVDMSAWFDRIPALLDAWYGGQEGGTALGQLLFGDYSPSAKLPATFERRWEENPSYHSYYPQKGDKRVEYTEGIFIGYRGYEKAGTKPLFPFGFGLSYSAFAYSDLKITAAAKGSGAQVEVTFRVKNTGSREAAEIAQLYVGDGHAPVPRPPKELKGFAKVSLRPGESKELRIFLDRRAFSYYDVARHDWTAAPGGFSILVGSSSADIRLQGKFSLAP